MKKKVIRKSLKRVKVINPGPLTAGLKKEFSAVYGHFQGAAIPYCTIEVDRKEYFRLVARCDYLQERVASLTDALLDSQATARELMDDLKKARQ